MPDPAPFRPRFTNPAGHKFVMNAGIFIAA